MKNSIVSVDKQKGEWATSLNARAFNKLPIVDKLTITSLLVELVNILMLHPDLIAPMQLIAKETTLEYPRHDDNSGIDL